MKISENRHQPDGVALPKTKAARGTTQAALENNINQQYSKQARLTQRVKSRKDCWRISLSIQHLIDAGMFIIVALYLLHTWR